MKFKEKLKIVLTKNIKIIIGIFIGITLNSVIFYFDIFDFDLFNKKYIKNLETELLELKEKLEQNTNNNNIKSTANKDDIIYYLIDFCFLIGSLFIFYYFTSSDSNMDIMNNSSNIFNIEENKPLNLPTTPTPTPPTSPAKNLVGYIMEYEDDGPIGELTDL